MWRRNRPDSETLLCSFCGKSQDLVQKLIASPRDDVRAFICDECVGICQSILEENRDAVEAAASQPERNEPHPPVDDQLVSKLVEAVKRWIAKESVGFHANREFAEMRSIAISLIGPKNRTVAVMEKRARPTSSEAS